MSALSISCKLLSDANLGAAVYPIALPQIAGLPCVLVSVIHEDQDLVIGGAVGAFTARVSLACHAATPAGVDTLAEAIKASLENVLHHQLDDGSEVTFWKEGTDVPDYSDDRTVFRRIFDWRMRWERPA
jgi:hypothetical protein